MDAHTLRISGLIHELTFVHGKRTLGAWARDGVQPIHSLAPGAMNNSSGGNREGMDASARTSGEGNS